jgi:hypothetical protein
MSRRIDDDRGRGKGVGIVGDGSAGVDAAYDSGRGENGGHHENNQKQNDSAAHGERARTALAVTFCVSWFMAPGGRWLLIAHVIQTSVGLVV